MKNNNSSIVTISNTSKKEAVTSYIKENRANQPESIQKGLRRNGYTVSIGEIRSVLSEVAGFSTRSETSTSRASRALATLPEGDARLVEKAGTRVVTGRDGMPIIEAHATNQIKTVDQLLEEAAYSPQEWEIVSSEASVSHQMSKLNGLVPLWRVKAKLKRKELSADYIADLFKAGTEAFKNALKIPMSKLAKKDKSTAKGVMVEFALPDLHLGKLAWDDETGGGHWDLGIAEKAWKDAVLDLASRAPKAEQAWIVVGNDFFNVDNQEGETTSGTPQDEDGRWQRTFQKGQELMFWTIALLRRKFPKVKVIMIYGNHDSQRSFYLGECLAARFTNDPQVEIDNAPRYRKYYQWGDTGLGYTHGDRVKVKDLANLCQNEAREIWGKTKRFELHLGHLHQDIVRTLGGVLVRWIPALCPPDAWHSKSGYTMSEKAAMLFEYDQRGMRNMLVHYPDERLFS